MPGGAPPARLSLGSLRAVWGREIGRQEHGAVSRARWSARPWIGGPLLASAGTRAPSDGDSPAEMYLKPRAQSPKPGWMAAVGRSILGLPDPRSAARAGGSPYLSASPQEPPPLSTENKLCPIWSLLWGGERPLPRLRGDPLAQRSPPGPHSRPCTWGLPGPRGRLSYLLFLIFFNLIFQSTHQSRAWRHVIKLLVSFK